MAEAATVNSETGDQTTLKHEKNEKQTIVGTDDLLRYRESQSPHDEDPLPSRPVGTKDAIPGSVEAASESTSLSTKAVSADQELTPKSRASSLEGVLSPQDPNPPACPYIPTTTTTAPSNCPFAHHVSPSSIRNSITDRVDYLTAFLGFGDHDVERLKKAGKILGGPGGMIEQMVDDMYEKLFGFDITKKVFMTRNTGFEGELPKKLDDLTLDSEQIKFRKIFMKVWANRILTSDYSDGKTWAYMDKVGRMHTGVHTFKKHKTLGNAPLYVPYRDIALLLGFCQNILHTAIYNLPEPTSASSTSLQNGHAFHSRSGSQLTGPVPKEMTKEEKIETLASITKVIWIQNDLFARHYIEDLDA